ncbi:GAF domain-containing protein [Deinococcus sonorensis]|uniref:histidine kinase n=1 Tax=Deinococcus sonorensis KR-87 TaxID=694439 RepID=A0AAU7U6G5_9DEIO
MRDGLPLDEHVAAAPELAAALEVFLALTDLAGSERDVLDLTRTAYDLIDTHLTGYSAAYFEARDQRWTAQTWSPALTDDQVDRIRAGLPLDMPAFARALETHHPVFIEAGHTEGRGHVDFTDAGGPSCVYPLVAAGEVRGLFVVGRRGGHPWRPRDRALVEALGRSLTLALDRTEQARGLREERAALEAFAVFTEQAGSETDVLTLAREAVRVVRDNLVHVSVVYYERGGDRWTARVWSEDVAPEVIAQLVQGVPVDAPNLAEAVERGVTVFVDRWDAAADAVPAARAYGAAAFVPLFSGGEARWMLAVGTRDTRVWSEREKAVVRSVGRAFGLALDRAHTARQLTAQHLELDARTRALDGFAALTHELGVQADVYELIRRAQEVVLSLLSAGYVLYYEREGPRWRNRVQVGDVRDADLQAFIDAGPRVGATPSVDVPWTTRRALYQDRYARGSDTPPELVGHVSAAASLPVMRDGEPVGVFIAVLFEHRAWSREDRVVLETVVGSLGLALERAEQTRQLAEQRAEVEARNRVLSSFEAWTRDLTDDAGVHELIRRAQALLYELVPVQATVYYEREGDRWWVRSMLGEYGNDTLRQAHEVGLAHASTGNLRAPFESGEVTYVEPYDETVDGLGDATAHVRAMAMLPLGSSAGIRGIFGLARFERGGWSSTERSIIEAVGNSLRLALDRADKAADLARERTALAAHTAALTAANEELEAFAYSVSHDLRTPVRHITGYTTLLRRRLGGALDEQAARYLKVVEDAADRMNTLIDAMLDLSRTSRQPLQMGVVDLEALVRSVQVELDAGRRKAAPSSGGSRRCRSRRATTTCCGRCCSTCWATP